MPLEDSKRIAKNTLLLYFRMIFVMLISLYTSRVVLSQLGVADYGIYNVVGGIVAMFSILSASLSSAISRFLTFELGRKNEIKLQTIFSTSVIIQGVLGLIIVILVESIGVWFLNAKMNIAPNRMYAANWVLQCSIITFTVNMLSIPYNAAIIAHEKMKAFAYVSVLEVALKLGIAFLLYITWFDSLIAYAILLMLASIIIRITYALYCKRNFIECRFKRIFDRSLLKEMLSFSGWNFIGTSSAILRDQGVNIVLNLFCGTTVNAARGVAMQVYGAVHGFSQNFIIAVNPQIIKSYATGETMSMFNLAFRSSRFAYFLLFCISLPLILQMQWLLHIWLEVVPQYTVSFSILVLIFGMTEAISLPLQYVNQATGRIKKYQLTVGGLQMLNFPIAYLLLWCAMPPTSVFILAIIISVLCLIARTIILKRQIHFPMLKFYKEVITRITGVTIVGGIVPVLLIYLHSPTTIIERIGIMGVSITTAGIASLLIGCNASERNLLASTISKVLRKIKIHA